MSQLLIHPDFEPLMGALRGHPDYSIANMEGGRGGMKSEQSGKCSLAIAMEQPTRVLYFRETQASIRDSSHKLLSDAIYEHELSTGQNGPFEVQASRIIRADGDRIVSEFIFAGVREDPMAIKSLKGIKLAVGEEAGGLSQKSIETLEPTVLREEGAKLWYVWNPTIVTAPIWKHLMLKPPPRTIHIHTSYMDNPWLSETMRVQAEHMRDTDLKRYEHIWLGKPASEIEGAIYREEMLAMERDNRICHVPHNPRFPVHTAWDLGFGDPTCIIFFQVYEGWIHIIDYYQMSDRDITHYLIVLQQRQYLYGTDYLPHDAVDALIHSKLMGAGRSLADTLPVIMRQGGRTVREAPKLLKDTTLNKARMTFPRLRIDHDKCQQLIHALRMYQWDRLPTEDGKRKPLHDEYCHAPEALQVLSLMAQPDGMPVAPKIPRPRPRDVNPNAWMG